MGVPSAEEQVRFLRDVQALLEDGQFTATYKFALLISLADLAVESGVADDRPLELPLRAIAENFSNTTGSRRSRSGSAIPPVCFTRTPAARQA